jgi:uncharacterized membrane protein
MDQMAGWLGRLVGPEAGESIEGLVIGLAGVAILLVLALYVIAQVRANSTKQEPSAGDLLTKFRQMHSQGVLSDAEYRTIKTTLSPQVKAELTDKQKTG